MLIAIYHTHLHTHKYTHTNTSISQHKIPLIFLWQNQQNWNLRFRSIFNGLSAFSLLVVALNTVALSIIAAVVAVVVVTVVVDAVVVVVVVEHNDSIAQFRTRNAPTTIAAHKLAIIFFWLDHRFCSNNRKMQCMPLARCSTQNGQIFSRNISADAKQFNFWSIYHIYKIRSFDWSTTDCEARLLSLALNRQLKYTTPHKIANSCLLNRPICYMSHHSASLTRPVASRVKHSSRATSTASMQIWW